MDSQSADLSATSMPPSGSSAPMIAHSTMTNRLRSRGIVHSITEKGTARLIFDEDFGHFRGLLLNSQEESVSLTGTTSTTTTIDELVTATTKNLDPNTPTTSRMQITVVDGETGDKFCIENVAVTRIPKVNAITNSLNYWIEINHSAIKFKTKEVLIGNRADVEIQKYLGTTMYSEWSIGNGMGTLSRTGSRSIEHKTQVHVGSMTLNIAASERTEPSIRRVSACDGCATNIIEQSNDFLV